MERGLQPRRQDHRGRMQVRHLGRVGGVVLWDVAARKRLVDEPLPVKEGDVRSVAFSPDGKTIAAGSHARRRGAVGLWPHANAWLTSHSRVIGMVVRFGAWPSAQTARPSPPVYGGQRRSGGVVLWDVDLESWHRRAGRIANRNFTRKEWREYFPERPYRATFPDLPVPPE